MREILFRGKQIGGGEWVSGDLSQHKTGKVFIRKTASAAVGSFEVDPDTVGQYTGLIDKNGKKIFEGDLLNGTEYPFLRDNAHNYFAEVVWFENSPAFGIITHKNPLAAVRGISDGNADYIEDWDSAQWEVIGNIYDNPKLLEESK